MLRQVLTTIQPCCCCCCCSQEEAVRELAAALEAKDQELQASKQQAAAEADAAVLQRMQARESELTEMLNSAQSSLEAMQRLYTAAQNQLFELQSTREEAVAGRQVGRWPRDPCRDMSWVA